MTRTWSPSGTPRSCTFTWDEVSDNSEDKGHLNPLDCRQNDDDDSRDNVDLSFGEDEAEETHDREQEVRTSS